MNDPATKLPPRPLPEHMKQFGTSLFSYDYIQYAEFKRYADGVEAQLSLALELLRDAKYFVRYADEVGDGYSAKEWIERLSKSGLLGEIGGQR